MGFWDTKFTAEEQDEISGMVRLLMATFELGAHYGEQDDIVQAFEAVAGRYPFAIAMTGLERLILGKGDGQEPPIMPTAPMLANECRVLQYEQEVVAFEASANKHPPGFEPANIKPATPEKIAAFNEWIERGGLEQRPRPTVVGSNPFDSPPDNDKVVPLRPLPPRGAA